MREQVALRKRSQVLHGQPFRLLGRLWARCGAPAITTRAHGIGRSEIRDDVM